MEPRPVLRLNQRQLAQLIGYCAVYRSYLWQYTLPTPERNQALREIQTLQGRFEKAGEQGEAKVEVPFTEEEKITLKQLFSGMTQFYGTSPASEQRIQQLAELATLRVLIERTFREAS